MSEPTPSRRLVGEAVLRDPLVCELLAMRLVAVLTTLEPDGSVHAVPMWLAPGDGAILLATGSRSRKVRNLERDPRATFVLHDSRPGAEVCGASIRGHVELVRGAAAATLVREVHLRYVGDARQRLPDVEALGCTAAESWGTLRAWAWGLERCVDFLVTHSALDPKRICLIGHSRLGKTVLLAGAIDERVALVVPHQSGTGGCALSRDNDQETVQKINDRFPHWFNGAFKKFNGREAALPVDQHLLLALVAPRAVLDTEGERDVWANPPAALRALHAADPVWKFLGASGLHDDGLLSEPQTLAGNAVGKLLQYRCDTGHEMNLGYWNISLDFADAVLG